MGVVGELFFNTNGVITAEKTAVRPWNGSKVDVPHASSLCFEHAITRLEVSSFCILSDPPGKSLSDKLGNKRSSLSL